MTTLSRDDNAELLGQATHSTFQHYQRAHAPVLRQPNTSLTLGNGDHCCQRTGCSNFPTNGDRHDDLQRLPPRASTNSESILAGDSAYVTVRSVLMTSKRPVSQY